MKPLAQRMRHKVSKASSSSARVGHTSYLRSMHFLSASGRPVVERIVLRTSVVETTITRDFSPPFVQRWRNPFSPRAPLTRHFFSRHKLIRLCTKESRDGGLAVPGKLQYNDRGCFSQKRGKAFEQCCSLLDSS